MTLLLGSFLLWGDSCDGEFISLTDEQIEEYTMNSVRFKVYW